MTTRRKPTAGRKPARRGDSPTAPAMKPPRQLLADLRKLIEESRQTVARTVNTVLVWTYWNIGKRIREDILKQQRAD